MNTSLATTGGQAPARQPSFAPTTFGELLEFAKLIANSSLVPQDYRGRPGDIVVAVQTGAELGLSPMQSLQSVSVINGRPSVWGDGALALVRASGLLEDFEEGVDGVGDQRYGWCRAIRKGQPSPIEKRFSVADARKAGLWGKKGPWTSYTDRMLTMRARGFVLRDGFADALRGLITREEAQDLPAQEEVERGAVSDLPWATRKSELKAAAPGEQDLTAALEQSIEAATAEGAASTPEPVFADETGMNPPGASGADSDVEVASLFPDVPPPWNDEPVLINEVDRRRFHAARTEGKHSEEDAKRWLLQMYGITSSSQIQKAWLGDICRRMKDPAKL